MYSSKFEIILRKKGVKTNICKICFRRMQWKWNVKKLILYFFGVSKYQLEKDFCNNALRAFVQFSACFGWYFDQPEKY